MKNMILFQFFIAVVAASHVLQGDDKNFDDLVLKSNKTTLVDFYADWCRHCKNLMNTISGIADQFAEIEEIQIMKVNGDKNGKKLSKRYKIQGYPTLLLFSPNHTDPITYEGIRDQTSISNFIHLVSGHHARQDSLYGYEKDEQSVLKVLDGNLGDYETRGKTTFALVQLKNDYSSALLIAWNNVAEYSSPHKSNRKFIELQLSDTKKFLSDFAVKDLPAVVVLDGISGTKLIHDVGIKADYLSSLVNGYQDRKVNGEIVPDRSAGRILSYDRRIRFTDSKHGQNLLDDIAAAIEEKTSLTSENGAADDLRMHLFYQKMVKKILLGKESWLKDEAVRLEAMTGNNKGLINEKDLLFARKRTNVLKATIAGRRI